MRSTIFSVFAIAGGAVADNAIHLNRDTVSQIGDGQIQAPSIYTTVPAVASSPASSVYSATASSVYSAGSTPSASVVVSVPVSSPATIPTAPSAPPAYPQSSGNGSGGFVSQIGDGQIQAPPATSIYKASSTQPVSPPSAAIPPYSVPSNGTSLGSGGSGGGYPGGQPQTNSVEAISVRAGLMSAALAGVLFLCI